MNNIKAQDILVLLKLLAKEEQLRNWSSQEISEELNISPSQISAALKRIHKSRLFDVDIRYPVHSALLEFLVHGVKYCFPAEFKSVTRGIPTGYSAKPLEGQIASGSDLPPVWSHPEGETKGIALTPIYKTAPDAALKDSLLYKYLALVDMLRSGNARERKIAKDEFEKILL